MARVVSTIELVVFDIAGTLIEDHGEVVRSFAAALAKNGVLVSEDELLEWKGASKREVVRHFVERGRHHSTEWDQTVERTYTAFCEELKSVYCQGIKPIPGVASTLEWCHKHEVRAATTTGFDREVNDLILDQTGWRHFFVANISSSDIKKGRPAPFMIFQAMEAAGIEDVRQVMNVGDTPLDLRAGTRAGVRAVVGVLTGAHTKERLQREPHTDLIPSVAEIPTLIDQRFSSPR